MYLVQKEELNLGDHTHDDDLIWLDSIQSRIQNSGNPRQLIVGPASTGKTVLIQLKVLDLFRTNKDSKCLIILPLEQLCLKYRRFFLTASIPNEVCSHPLSDPKLIGKNHICQTLDSIYPYIDRVPYFH